MKILPLMRADPAGSARNFFFNDMSTPPTDNFCYDAPMTQDEAVAILKTGANVFLTGEPGSGKTHTVNAFVAWLRDCGIEPSVTASTGIAATHIGGMTIHSWSGIGVRNSLNDYDLDQITQNERVVKRVRYAHTLIIDEISMLSAATFGMVDRVCRAIRTGETPFGGLQVVVVGDFFQLPPIQRREPGMRQTEMSFGQDDEDVSVFACGSRAWRELNPIVCYLSEQHRQEDGAFLDILSAIRRDEVSREHKALLDTRRVEAKSVDITHLYSHNADVDRINDIELGKIKGDSRAFLMTSTGSQGLIMALKRGCLSPETLSLKIGARVMCTKNDLMGKYVNGTIGTVKGFVKDSGCPIVETKDKKTLVIDPVEWAISDGGHVLAKIAQIPLRLAWAITVHKSQGMSLDAAHMDLSSAFEYGQGYVAISRVRTLAGLSLGGINARALEVHPEISEKDVEFRSASARAQAAFARMEAGELATLQENFVRACGGRIATKTELKVRAKEKEKKATTLASMREKFPNAYRPWTKDEDADLVDRFNSDERQSYIAQKLGRKPGAIHMRLVKLGLIEVEEV